MAKLIGTDPSQVPTNADLGTMAYQNAERPALGQTVVKSAGTALIVERTGDAPNLQLKGNGQNLGHIYAFQNGSGGDIAFYPANSSGSITQRMKIHSEGYVTMPAQPAFLARPTSTQNNVAENEVIVFGTEIFDQGADFSSNTFTAPVTGRYQLNAAIRVSPLDTAATWNRLEVITSNRSYNSAIIDPGVLASDPVYWHFQTSVLAEMDAGDTAQLRWGQNGGATQVEIDIDSHFSGYLVA